MGDGKERNLRYFLKTRTDRFPQSRLGNHQGTREHAILGRIMNGVSHNEWDLARWRCLKSIHHLFHKSDHPWAQGITVHFQSTWKIGRHSYLPTSRGKPIKFYSSTKGRNPKEVQAFSSVFQQRELHKGQVISLPFQSLQIFYFYISPILRLFTK